MNAFDAAKVKITRIRFSYTQGEVLVEYDGQRIDQYGDKIAMREGVWQGWQDAYWIAVAKREALARGLAVEPVKPTTFEAGKTYATRSICDHNSVVSITVAKRTAKTITTAEGKVLRIGAAHDGRECVKPWGSYSMCPIITAGDARAA